MLLIKPLRKALNIGPGKVGAFLALHL